MKLKHLSAAIMATSAMASMAYAADAPTVYGKMNVSVNQTEAEDSAGGTYQDNWELNSNASRLGVKGSIAISDSLKAIYKAEYEIYVDDGDDGKTDSVTKKSNNSEFSQRNTYVGLQGDFGTVFAGKHDTPTKLAQGEIDKFNDLPVGDIKNIFDGEVRADNVIAYASPNLSGFTAILALVPGEDDGYDTTGGPVFGKYPTDPVAHDGLADSISLSLGYQQDALSVAFAIDDNVGGLDLMRLVGEYDFGAFKLGAMYQSAELNSDTEKAALILLGDTVSADSDGWLLSGEFKASENVVIKAQYGINEYDWNENLTTGTDEGTLTAIGVDYKLSDAAKVFAYYANVEWDYDETTAFVTTKSSEEESTFGVGYELKF